MVRKRNPGDGRLRELAVARLVPSVNAAEFIYGVITIGAVMAAESAAHETYLETIASALIATLLYWLARAYTDLLGHRLASRERLTTRALGRELVADWAIVRGASIPLTGLLIAWIAGADQQTGVTVALYTAVATIVLFELIAGIRAKSSARELLFKTAVGVAMGLAILAMKGILR
jgi:membrane protein YqaA with SNARE-associated domain